MSQKLPLKLRIIFNVMVVFIAIYELIYYFALKTTSVLFIGLPLWIGLLIVNLVRTKGPYSFTVAITFILLCLIAPLLGEGSICHFNDGSAFSCYQFIYCVCVSKICFCLSKNQNKIFYASNYLFAYFYWFDGKTFSYKATYICRSDHTNFFANFYSAKKSLTHTFDDILTYPFLFRFRLSPSYRDKKAKMIRLY